MNAGSTLVIVYLLGRYHQHSQTFVDGEIQHLRRLGHEVHVVAVRRGQEDRSADPHVVYLESAGRGKRATIFEHLRWLLQHPRRYLVFVTRVWRLRTERMGRPPRKLPWLRLPAVARELERAGVQVVHAHFAWAGAAAAACIGALLDLPWSMTVHANDIFADQRNLKAKLSMVELVITVCDYNREWLDRHTSIRPSALVLTCGVDEPIGVPPGEPSVDVVAVGRLIEKKGVDVLVRAVGVLAAEGLRPSVEIIGDGPLRGQLEELSASLGTTRLVTFTGEMDHAAALARIAAARIFCLPCRVASNGDRDAMPTVIKEAMIAGVPVVSTRVVGIPEMVDSSCGRLVDADDVVGLAAALRELLSDTRLTSVLGASAASRALERYTLHGQVTRLARVFGR